MLRLWQDSGAATELINNETVTHSDTGEKSLTSGESSDTWFF